MIPERPYAIVDVETTGGSPLGHRVIEIGIVRVEPGAGPVAFSSLVNPARPVSPFIPRLTGIRPEALALAPSFEEIADRVAELLKGALFVAHNARFDYAFVKAEFARLGAPFRAATLCSARLSRAVYPEHRHHDLSSLIERFGLRVENRHRALDDARAVHDFFARASAERGAAFAEAWTRLSAKRIAQCDVPRETLESLPEAPGVYIFYGPAREVLYVGKSKNLKERVLTHLNQDTENGKTLAIARKVADVEVRRTPGELSALLLESELVKSLAPIYNRRLRVRREIVVALREAGPGGYSTVRLAAVPRLEGDLDAVAGIFKSLEQAKEALYEAAKAWKLCPKLLRLQKSADTCFSYHLKSCLGACAGEEAPQDYNARFAKAFPPAIRRWPYRTPVVIEERDAEASSGEAFVVDRWRILSRIRYSEGAEEETAFEQAFDFDAYRVLRDAVDRKYASVRITPAPAAPAEALD